MATLGTSDGVDLLVPAAPEIGGWRVLARLWVDGLESRRWTGYSCVTGSGRYAAVAFGPEEMLQRPVLRERGGFAAVVDLRSGAREVVPERVALQYHTPSCGPHDEIVFSRTLGGSEQATELLRVDGRGRVLGITRAAAQLTSAAPTTGAMYAAAGSSLVAVSATGRLRTVQRAAGPVFDVHVDAGGTLYFLTKPAADTVTAYRREPTGRMTLLARAAVGAMRMTVARGGQLRLAGRPTWSAGLLPVVASAAAPAAVSLDGSLVVDAVVPGTGRGPDGTANAQIRAHPAGSRHSVVTTGVSTGWRPASAPSGAASSAALRTVASTTSPKCAVPRLDYTTQVLQPSAKEVEWAADRAVRGALTISRPANWMKNGLSSYVPQTLFRLPALSGGGRIPSQVLLGVLAQESNFNQASYHALPGVPGDPLVADYYGTVYDASGRIIGMNFADADCGYGLGQLTTHMTTSDSSWSTTMKRAVAVDYAANVAAAAQVLATCWNQAAGEQLLANGADPSKVENWYFAIWCYNTGVYPASGGGPHGVGWTNNPANASYNPNRTPFLRLSYADAAHPGDWPYQEKVLGWAERAQLDYRGRPEYQPTASLLQLPTNYFQFCSPQVNDCDPNYHNGALSYCTRADRECWWHGPSAWTGQGTAENPLGYVAGAPEPADPNPYPPSCTPTSSPIARSPNLSRLPSGAVVTDDVPTSSWNLVGCAGRSSAGSFSFSYGTDAGGAQVSKIDLHQIGVGYGGHVWFAHTVDPTRSANVVTGTWTPPAGTTGWRRIFVHIPDNGATTFQADYRVWTGTSSAQRTVNQRWNANSWFDLGSFQLSSGAKVTLSNATRFRDYSAGQIDIAWDAVAFAPSTKPRVSYVALGDSYSSGQGVEPYYADSDNGGGTGYVNGCHRSPSAYGPGVFGDRSAGDPNSEFHFLACSGAVIDDVDGSSTDYLEVPQLRAGWLDATTTLVTVGVGGDDARFAAILKSCFMTIHDCTSPTYRMQGDPEPLVSYEPKVIDGLQAPLTSLLNRVRVLAPNARLLLVGYPHVMTTGSRRTGVDCLAVGQDVVDWFAQMADRLDGVMLAAARSSGVTFVDTRPGMAGHEACVSSHANEWLNAVVAHSASGSGSATPGVGSFHPDADGQFAFRTAVDHALG